jgi:YfiH family protein
MTEVEVTEVEVTGSPVPRFELEAWREWGVVAGVTGRGTGPEPFDLGLGTEQPVRAVLARWRDLRAAIGGQDGVVIARQVHGTSVLWHEQAAGITIFDDADGHATRRERLLLTVSLADCIPIYLFDPRHRAIALLHSGWNGTAGRILEAGIKRLAAAAKSDPADLVVHCGVGICGACYEVGPEVATACGRPAAERVHLDLRGVIAEQAKALGVERVTVSSRCAAHDHLSFFSHRRSGGRDGRMVAYLGLR